jgi:hypothetical protein
LPKGEWKDNIEIDLRKTDSEGWTELSLHRQVVFRVLLLFRFIYLFWFDINEGSCVESRTFLYCGNMRIFVLIFCQIRS